MISAKQASMATDVVINKIIEKQHEELEKHVDCSIKQAVAVGNKQSVIDISRYSYHVVKWLARRLENEFGYRVDFDSQMITITWDHA